MKNFIDKIDFYELEPQRYWSMPASWAPDRKKQEVRNAIFSGDYLGARKMDGAFYKFLKDEDGNMMLLGRNKGVGGEYLNKIEWVPHLQPFFDSLPNGTCLLGEIYFPKKEGSNHVTSIMGCLKDKAIARQNVDKLHYYVFDVLAFDGYKRYTNYFETRVKLLDQMEGRFKCPYVEYALYYSGEELWNKLQSILAEGGEGIVITKRDTGYQPGKRPARQTLKVKKELQETMDVVVLGANPPTKIYNGKDIMNWKYWVNARTGEKLTGNLYKDYSDGKPIEPVTKTYWHEWAGSFVIGMKKDDKYVVVGSLSGLTEEMLENWKQYKGKVLEITGMEIMNTENKGIRHPRLVRVRDDLRPSDCDWYRWFGGED